MHGIHAIALIGLLAACSDDYEIYSEPEEATARIDDTNPARAWRIEVAANEATMAEGITWENYTVAVELDIALGQGDGVLEAVLLDTAVDDGLDPTQTSIDEGDFANGTRTSGYLRHAFFEAEACPCEGEFLFTVGRGEGSDGLDLDLELVFDAFVADYDSNAAIDPDAEITVDVTEIDLD